LLNVLDEVLKGERIGPSTLQPPPPVLLTPEIIPSIDLYLVEIETRMKSLHSQLCQLAAKAELVGFSKLVAGLDRLEAVKTFIVLLFLAQRGKIGLWQEDDISELYITVTGDPAFEGRATGIV
jgi:chromatin segregation and condensation protein Rec8/ScpA/Scc1 (kleisin family)